MIETTMRDVVALVHRSRLPLQDEKMTQLEFGELLRANGFEFEREVRLSAKDVIDFLLPGGVGLELKLRSSSKMQIYRQLERYAAHEQIKALVLASNRAIGMPAAISDKPVAVASLGRGWLA